ncbi:hypothetical protein LCGC14_1416420 [marine sediment metagenome]|uniref:Uncharacterized protein n=1 Tax=marine sediment metagenome TaxID=412755 RepID=A0A0F9MUF2_9ZZZZ
MKEFNVNEHLTLKLEHKETFIYVNKKKFLQCKILLLNIPVDKISTFDEIQSIDEVTELLDKSMEREREPLNIDPEVEFWGHCSV